ncbi:selenocysteine-specific translation elongation factor [candidate division KSB1 bacterium]|nr:selenocysteine-specific translation elongation factor [candidate division KSB1 bacterium]
MKRHIVMGTAGHIDHGKTSLVRALTNMETDRLEEEIARGMTIDLGFAFLGENITIIDVPGHERFIRNMVAGVSTIDLVLFVIAADDGIMPQTIEHLEILNLLQIKQGIIVLNKIDLVDEEWLELVEEEIRELVKATFLAQAPVMRVSSLQQTGIPQLTEKIFQLAQQIPPRKDRGVFRLPIDRVFTMKGFGTVVAGTVLSGNLQVDQTIELLPKRTPLRVRGLQIHGKSVSKVVTGDRAAINLAGIEKEEVQRGDVLAAPGIYQPTMFYDTKIYLLKSTGKSIKHNTRVHLHIGTSEVTARLRLLETDELKPGTEAFAQLSCEAPVVAETGDRFVLRNYSPMFTLGGGIILQVNPPRYRRFDSTLIQRLQILERGDLLDIVEQATLKGKIILKPLEEIIKATGLPENELWPFLNQLIDSTNIQRYSNKNKTYLIHSTHVSNYQEQILKRLEIFHQNQPLKQGLSASEIHSLLNLSSELFFAQQILQKLVDTGKIEFSGAKVRLANYSILLSPELEKLKNQIENYFQEQKYSPPHTNEIITQFKRQNPDVEKIIAYLLEHKILIYIDDGYLLHRNWVQEARHILLKHFQTKNELTVGEFRDYLQASRKYVVPLLNYFDQQGITTRQEDIRILQIKAQ